MINYDYLCSHSNIKCEARGRRSGSRDTFTRSVFARSLERHDAAQRLFRSKVKIWYNQILGKCVCDWLEKKDDSKTAFCRNHYIWTDADCGRFL